MQRRALLRAAAGAGFGALAASRSARAADAEIVLTPGQPGPEISPHIYGHFIEHLGGVIYDGIWVGRDSRIPNIGGIRKQFVDDMKRIGAPNLRWPGDLRLGFDPRPAARRDPDEPGARGRLVRGDPPGRGWPRAEEPCRPTRR